MCLQDSASIPLLSDRSNPSRSLATTSGGGGGGGTDYPIELRADAELHADDPPPTAAIKRSGMGRAVSLLTTCYSSSEDNEMSLSASARIDDLVPPCFVHAGNMPRLIKVSKKIFKISKFSKFYKFFYISSSYQ